MYILGISAFYHDSAACLIHNGKIIAEKRVEKAAKHYAMRVNEARNLANSFGAKFLHFYQPMLFDIERLTSYESKLYEQNPCFTIAASVRSFFNEIFLKQSPESIDLTQIYTNKNLFFDYTHVSSFGYLIAAEQMTPFILDEINN